MAQINKMDTVDKAGKFMFYLYYFLYKDLEVRLTCTAVSIQT